MRVLILGGGYAGATVARGLGDRAAVTIVADDNFLLFTPMLAEVASGDVDPRHIITPVRQLAPQAALVQGRVATIDIAGRSVEVQPRFDLPAITLAWDVLVLALGSVPNTFGVPGAEEYCLFFKTILDALRIRNRLLALLEAGSSNGDPQLTRVAVIGAGYAGVELAAALSDFLRSAAERFYPEAPTPHLFLVDSVDRVTPTLSPGLSVAAARALHRRGVELVLGSAVAGVTGKGLVLGDGRFLEAGTVIWVAGVRPNPLVADIGLVTAKGRLVVDHSLTAAPNIFALGDLAAGPPDARGPLPLTAQVALAQGRYLGHHLFDLVAGRPVPPFSYRHKGELVSLGRRNAVGRVVGVPVSGIVAWFLWRSYYLLRLPGLFRKLRVALDWTLDLVFPPDIAWLPSSDLGPDPG
jgi:NADH dehydrogenase